MMRYIGVQMHVTRNVLGFIEPHNLFAGAPHIAVHSIAFSPALLSLRSPSLVLTSTTCTACIMSSHFYRLASKMAVDRSSQRIDINHWRRYSGVRKILPQPILSHHYGTWLSAVTWLAWIFVCLKGEKCACVRFMHMNMSMKLLHSTVCVRRPPENHTVHWFTYQLSPFECVIVTR